MSQRMDSQPLARFCKRRSLAGPFPCLHESKDGRPRRNMSIPAKFKSSTSKRQELFLGAPADDWPPRAVVRIKKSKQTAAVTARKGVAGNQHGITVTWET